MAFSSLYYTLTTGVLNLWESLIKIIYIIPSWEGSRVILDEHPEIEAEDLQDVQLHGKVELSHISFRYSSDTPYIHKDVSLSAEQGELIAIVGKAGCGNPHLSNYC